MNLVLRFTLFFVLISLVVFIIGGVISYQVMKREIDAEQRRFLLERLDQTKRYIERRNPTNPVDREKLHIEPLRDSVQVESIVFSDTLVEHSTLQRMEMHLKLDAFQNVNNRGFKINMYDVIVESDDISDGVTESLVKTYLILLGAVLLLALLLSYYQLGPFRATLAAISRFSISSKKALEFPRSSIKEFRVLHDFLREMSDKVRKDYQNLKEFSENASHELQTPIAITQSKLDVLIQDESLTQDQLELINSIQHSITRLSKLSNSLTLLTKIENQEFSSEEEVNLREIVQTIVNGFSELMELKGLKFTAELKGNPSLKADPVLIEILITNLLNNAIRHNIEEGFIHLFMNDYSLIITNSGPEIDGDPELLFNRFRKSNQTGSSLGLGLSIVKKICDRYALKLQYENKNEQHRVSVVVNAA
jgi:signal transduction histidine kinase